MSQSNKKK